MANGKNTSLLSGALSGATTGASVGGPYGAAIGGLLGGAAGYFGGQDDNSNDYYNQMMDRLNAINVPGIEQLTFTPEELSYLGNLTPEQQQQFVLEKSAMENVSVDPRLRQEQMKALDKVSQLADKGFSDEDMMAFNIARQQAAGEAEAKQQQILQNMQQRGQGGSGAELIARLTSAQNSANQLSLEQQKQALAQAEARKNALTMLANQSGSLRNQDFGEQSQVAQAKDAVARWNAQNAQNVEGSNVAARNNAALRNLETQQNLANQNVGVRNQAKQNQVNAQKDLFNMNYMKATGQNAISGQQAGNAARQAANTNAGIGQIGQGLVQMASSGNFKNLFGNSNNAPVPKNLNNPDQWEQNDVTTQIVNDPSKYMG